jgi:3-hydroxyacyl-CoA dehydrogenase, C-terminal domain
MSCPPTQRCHALFSTAVNASQPAALYHRLPPRFTMPPQLPHHAPAAMCEHIRAAHADRVRAQAVLDTLDLGLKIKKTQVVVGNCTGFAVNRVFFPYTMAACLLIDLGADPYTVDKIIKGMFGMPMGPFRLSDLVRSARAVLLVVRHLHGA